MMKTRGLINLAAGLTLICVAAKRASAQYYFHLSDRTNTSFTLLLDDKPGASPVRRSPYHRQPRCEGYCRCGVDGGCEFLKKRSRWRSLLAIDDALSSRHNEWPAHTELQYSPGTDRMLGNGLLFLPLWQDDATMLFADLRGQSDDNGGHEGNWGLGLRSILCDSCILGAYTFYDRRWTENSNEFDQLTVGIEALAVQWEARINGYLPDTRTKTIGSGRGASSPFPRAVFNGNTIEVVSGGGLRHYEKASYGVDAEIGALLAAHGDSNDVELRGFVGGFHFDTDIRGLPNISGPRTRIELRMEDLKLLGNQSRLTLGAEHQWDEVRDNRFSAVVRLRIPLGSAPRRRLSPLRRRMTERIVRDEDVVTNVVRQGLPESREPALYAATGQPIGVVHVVDARTANVAQAVQNAGAGSTVIVDGSAGVLSTNASIRLANHQTLRGAGFDVLGANTGAVTAFGLRPTINAANNTQDVVVVGVDATVRDLNVTGGRFGIATGNNGTDSLSVGSRILHNQVIGASADGLSFGDIDGTVANNTAEASGRDGFSFAGLGGTFNHNTATGNGRNGFSFAEIDNSFDNNTAGGNGRDGFFGGDVNDAFSNNLASSNGRDGFSIANINGMFSNNTATSSGRDGFHFANVSGLFSDNLATDSDRDGFSFDDVFATATFRDNTANNNLREGYNNHRGEVLGTIVNNTGSGNQRNNTFP